MFNSVALEVVIGLVFVYLLYSLLVSVIQEIIATNFNFRAKVLYKSIERMLADDSQNSRQENGLTRTFYYIFEKVRNYLTLFYSMRSYKDSSLVAAFYCHPLIKYMSESKHDSKPSYISADNFSKVIIDLLNGVDLANETNNMERIKESILAGKLIHNNSITTQFQSQISSLTNINEDTRLMLISLAQDSENSLGLFKLKLEKWFLDTQERASEWYKKYTQVLLFVIGFSIAIAFNVDTLVIIKKLSKDPKLRDDLLKSSIAFAETNAGLKEKLKTLDDKNLSHTSQFKTIENLSDSINKESIKLMSELDSLVKNDIHNVNNILGLGWKDVDMTNIRWEDIKKNCNSTSFIGWLITAIALSLGAPFWFDTLNKLIKLRGARKEIDTQYLSSTNNEAGGSKAISVIINNANKEEEAVG